MSWPAALCLGNRTKGRDDEVGSRHFAAVGLAILGLALIAPPLTAQPPVDLDALIPPPPPGADCQSSGPGSSVVRASWNRSA